MFIRMGIEKRNQAFIVLLFLLTTFTVAHGAERELFVGEIEGVGPIVMELIVDKRQPDLYVGRYFYRKKGIDIPLAGDLANLVEALPLVMVDDKDRKIDPKIARFEERFYPSSAGFHGKRDGIWYRGEWSDAKTKQHYPFTLKRQDRYNDHYDVFAYDEYWFKALDGVNTAYIDLKTDHAMLPVGPVIGDKEIAWQMVRDPVSLIEYPRFVRFPGDLVALNKALAEHQSEYSLDYLGCRSAVYYDTIEPENLKNDFNNFHAEIIYASRDFVSIREGSLIFCAGNGPFDISNDFTLVAASGFNVLDWADVLDIYIKEEGAETKTYSERFLAFLSRYIPKNEKGDDGCFTEEMLRSYLYPGFQKAGMIQFSIQYAPRYNFPCSGEGFGIAVGDMKDFFYPGKMKLFQAKKHGASSSKK